MARVLSDFRIESDTVVLLSFLDGASFRVRRNELDEYLNPRDLAKVEEALSLRRRFIKDVLPPTALVLMLAATAALGSYDAKRLAQIWQERQPTAASVKSSASAPAAQIPVDPRPAEAEPQGALSPARLIPAARTPAKNRTVPPAPAAARPGPAGGAQPSAAGNVSQPSVLPAQNVVPSASRDVIK